MKLFGAAMPALAAGLLVSSNDYEQGRLQANETACPAYLDTIWHMKREEDNIKVVEATKDGNPGFAAPFNKKVRYLVYDKEDPLGFAGTHCHVQSAVTCKKPADASTEKSCTGRPCEPDFRHPPMTVVRLQIAAAVTGLVSSMGTVAPKNVAVIGIGGGNVPSWYHAALPSTSVIAVDIDPRVVKVATECFGLPVGEPNFQAHAMDGMKLIKEAAAKSFDVIMIDAPMVMTLWDKGLKEIASKLADGGVLTANGNRKHKEFQAFRTSVGQLFPNKAFVASVPKEGQLNDVILAFAPGGKDVQAPSTNVDELKKAGAPEEAAIWAGQQKWKKI